MRILQLITAILVATTVAAQEHLQKRALVSDAKKIFTIVKENPIKPYYMVKNSWGKSGQYKGIWYMSRDYMMLNTTYLFLNRHAMSEGEIPILK